MWLGTNLNTAVPLLRETISEYGAAGEQAAAAEALLRTVRTIKERNGNWKEAGTLAQRLGSLNSDLLAVERAHLQHLAGESIVVTGGGPAWYKAATGLMTKHDQAAGRDHLQVILDDLDTREPLSRRYEYLWFFRHVPRMSDVADFEEGFRRIAPPPQTA